FGIDPRAPRTRVFLVSRAHRRERDAGGAAERTRRRELDDAAREPAVGQDRIELGPAERERGRRVETEHLPRFTALDLRSELAELCENLVQREGGGHYAEHP